MNNSSLFFIVYDLRLIGFLLFDGEQRLPFFLDPPHPLPDYGGAAW
jgi:hypothetical protein